MDNKIYNLLILSGAQNQIDKIQKCNEFTQQFGVTLSKKDSLTLLESRKKVLKEQERVEFGEGILPKIIFTFCDSPYIYQDNYVETIDALQHMFYYYKNESLEELSDDELLDFMKKHFDGDCQGSLEYLEETILDAFSRKIRNGEDLE